MSVPIGMLGEDEGEYEMPPERFKVTEPIVSIVLQVLASNDPGIKEMCTNLLSAAGLKLDSIKYLLSVGTVTS